MGDIFSILQSNYNAVGNATYNRMPYVAVDRERYQGTWEGAYSDNTKFKLQISDITGFRAKALPHISSTSPTPLNFVVSDTSTNEP